MGYHPRIECKKIATFQTTRSRCSELWFVNNSALDQDILGYAAKYSAHHKVKLYAMAIEGNHIQFPAHFPKANRAHFMRDFNSLVAKAVARRQSSYPGGKLWARRYSAEYLPGAQDIEEQFFYTVLQPVQDGLVDDIKDYPGYNCFEDAISGVTRKYPVVNWKAYNDTRRWDPTVTIEEFTELHDLRYERLPGYKNLPRAEYMKLMREKLRERTVQVLEERQSPKGTKRKSLGAKALKEVKPGASPRSTKTSSRYQHRPRILSKDNERRAQGKSWYFSIYFKYREVSEKFRGGDLRAKFPAGTYRPPTFTVGYGGTIV